MSGKEKMIGNALKFKSKQKRLVNETIRVMHERMSSLKKELEDLEHNDEILKSEIDVDPTNAVFISRQLLHDHFNKGRLSRTGLRTLIDIERLSED
jgi:hypothetical protein